MIVIKDKSHCCGCAACVNICPQKCISMVEDSEGFRYPKVDTEKCINCGMCEKVCIYCSVDKDLNNTNNIVACFAAYVIDDRVREKSSSGGVFALLAKRILQRGGIVVGVCCDKRCGARHVLIEDEKDLNILQGSKYVQSDTADIYLQVREILNQKKEVLFSGTPCQIRALKKFLGNKTYDGLYCVDIFCHGVPGIKTYKAYATWLQNAYGDKIRGVNFRDKSKGWKNYSVKVDFDGGKTYQKIFREDPYMKIFLRDIALRPSCYSCISKNDHMQADITIGDFWGCDDVCPDMNDDAGLSAVIVRSDKGKRLLDEIADELYRKEVGFEDIARGNPALIKSVTQKGDRSKFFKSLEKEDYEALAQRVSRKSISEKIKSKLSALKRKLFNK